MPGQRMLTLVPLLQLLLIKVSRLLKLGELFLGELRLSAGANHGQQDVTRRAGDGSIEAQHRAGQ